MDPDTEIMDDIPEVIDNASVYSSSKMVQPCTVKLKRLKMKNWLHGFHVTSVNFRLNDFDVLNWINGKVEKTKPSSYSSYKRPKLLEGKICEVNGWDRGRQWVTSRLIKEEAHSHGRILTYEK